MFEYTTLTVEIRGAKSGLFSIYQRKGLKEESARDLAAMGRDGWELTGVIPLAVGAMGGQWVDSAICFFKRLAAARKDSAKIGVRGTGEALEAGAFDILVKRVALAERLATEAGRRQGFDPHRLGTDHGHGLPGGATGSGNAGGVNQE